MHQIIAPGTPVGKLANATATTGVPNPRCSTPGCDARAVVRATVDVHFATGPTWRHDELEPYRTQYVACLPCYGQLRRGQADGYVEIVAAGAL